MHTPGDLYQDTSQHLFFTYRNRGKHWFILIPSVLCPARSNMEIEETDAGKWCDKRVVLLQYTLAALYYFKPNM